jgi:hypothetical protein
MTNAKGIHSFLDTSPHFYILKFNKFFVFLLHCFAIG